MVIVSLLFAKIYFNFLCQHVKYWSHIIKKNCDTLLTHGYSNTIVFKIRLLISKINLIFYVRIV